ncbi:anaerobic ribonucleoside-triphosphate reductase activating protein [Candidatus Bathyarchaeota archaeon]|nr:anaerobic ribonucleoside-triphosphate reductase activating protein [Candidatus Bathyarchaeota archaeon]
MKFSGVRKTSLIDFPDRISSVLFTPDCNLRCPYCHNWRIVVNPRPPFLNEKEVLQVLEERKRYVDAVVVTGGEPTMHREIPRFLGKLREKGFAVKLDTNGFFPKVLEKCLPQIDYVALDLKTSLAKYSRLGAKETRSLLQAVEVLKSEDMEYEFRTTVVPGFVDKEEVLEMREIVEGGKLLAFQQFVPGDTLDKTFSSIEPHSVEVISSFAEIMKDYVDEIVLRV